MDIASDITCKSKNTLKKLRIANAAKVQHTVRGATDELTISFYFECNIKFKDKRDSYDQRPI